DALRSPRCTLSLHDALPISQRLAQGVPVALGPALQDGQLAEAAQAAEEGQGQDAGAGVAHATPLARVRDGLQGLNERTDQRACQDRKSTRLNSSHRTISYAV